MRKNLTYKIFYAAQKHVINLFNDFGKIMAESNIEATKRAGLKILTLNQVL